MINPAHKMHSTDRKLVLAIADGASAAKTATGMLDKRLFTGENSIHLKMEPDTTLWYFQYDQNGVLPEPLRCKFTGFKVAKKFAEDYFKKRNVVITEVIE